MPGAQAGGSIGRHPGLVVATFVLVLGCSPAGRGNGDTSAAAKGTPGAKASDWRHVEPPEQPKRSEWTGGGRIPIADHSFELPADTRLLVKIHPARTGALLRAASAKLAKVGLVRRSSAEAYARAPQSALLRVLPRLFLIAGERDSYHVPFPFELAELLERFRSERRIPGLDPGRPVVMAVATARFREATRVLRLQGADTWRIRPYRHLPVRMWFPSRDADALSIGLDTACEALLATAARREVPDDESRRQDELRDLHRMGLCGTRRASAREGDYVVLDLLVAVKEDARLRGRPPEDVRVTPTAAEDKIRRTPALATFLDPEVAAGAYVTMRGTAALDGALHLARTLHDAEEFANRSTLWEPGALEREDLAVTVEGDGSGGFVASYVGTHTTHGREVSRAGRIDTTLPAIDIDDPFLSVERRWDIRKAAEVAKVPRWLATAYRESDGDYNFSDADDDLSFWEALRWWTAYPTGMMKAGARSDDTAHEFPFALLSLIPSALRAEIGAGDSGGVRGAAALASLAPSEGARAWLGEVRDKLDLSDASPFELRREQNAWRVGWHADPDAVASERGEAPRQSYLVADLDRVAAAMDTQPSRATRQSARDLRARARKYADAATKMVGPLADARRKQARILRRRAERLEAGGERGRAIARKVFRAADRLTVVAMSTDRATGGRLHLGTADLPAFEIPETDIELNAPDAPPLCYTSLVRTLGRHDGHPLGHVRDREVDLAAERLAELEAARRECGELSPSAARDLDDVLSWHALRTADYLYVAGQLEDAVPFYRAACNRDLGIACDWGRAVASSRVPRAAPAKLAGDDTEGWLRHSLVLAPGTVIASPLQYPLLGRRVTWSAVSALPEDFGDTDLRNIDPSGLDRSPGHRGLFLLAAADPDHARLFVVADQATSAGHLHEVWRRIVADQPLRLVTQGTREHGPELWGRKGFVVLKPPRSEPPDVRVTLGAGGAAVHVDGEPVASGDGCGVAVCPSLAPNDADKLMDALRSQFESGVDREGLRATYGELADHWRLDAVWARVDAVIPEDAAPARLQLRVDAGVPVGVVASLAARADASGSFSRVELARAE